LQERQAARIELQRAHDELEVRIAERTQVLVDANTSMESKLCELGEAERMLRATQDHAIQAGKACRAGADVGGHRSRDRAATDSDAHPVRETPASC
jgi:two-component system C4-dicarboxylate transport sensor histidine kinase DctB